MTNIRIMRAGDRYAVDIVGHADYCPGNDIVCSAVSMLAFTLVQRLEDLTAEGKVSDFAYKMEPGDVHILFKDEGKDEEAKHTLKTIMTGFEMIEATYPDHVRAGWET